MPGGLPSLVHSAGLGAARKGGASCLSRVLTGEKPQRPAGSSNSEKPQGALVGGVRRPGPQATPMWPASPTTQRGQLPAREKGWSLLPPRNLPEPWSTRDAGAEQPWGLCPRKPSVLSTKSSWLVMGMRKHQRRRHGHQGPRE